MIYYFAFDFKITRGGETMLEIVKANERDTEYILEILKKVATDGSFYKFYSGKLLEDISFIVDTLSPRIMRGILFEKDTDLFLFNDNKGIVGIALLSYPSAGVRSTAASLDLLSFKHGYESKLFDNIFKKLPHSITKISIKMDITAFSILEELNFKKELYLTNNNKYDLATFSFYKEKSEVNEKLCVHSQI